MVSFLIFTDFLPIFCESLLPDNSCLGQVLVTVNLTFSSHSDLLVSLIHPPPVSPVATPDMPLRKLRGPVFKDTAEHITVPALIEFRNRQCNSDHETSLDTNIHYSICWFSCHCFPLSSTKALSHAFHSYIIPSYWVESLVVVRHRRLGLDYSAAISY